MKSRILLLSSIILVAISISCNKLNDAETIDPIHAGLADWTEATHGKTDPNYDVVFPQDKLNTLEITMTAADWAAIKADMKTLSGSDFGEGGGMVGGGPVGGGPVGGGQGGGGQMGGGPAGGIPAGINLDSLLKANGGMLPGGQGGGVPAGVNLDSLLKASGGGQGGGGQAGGGGGGASIFSGNPIYVATSVKFNGKEWYKVGFRVKGNSSLSQTWRSGIYKLPFRLKFDEFEDKYPEVTDQRFHGFQELSMSPAQGDASVMRDKVAADIFRAAGIPAANSAFYKVFINFGDGLKYCGVYTMLEIVPDSMVKNQFGEDKGNIYKPESTFQTFAVNQFEKKNNETQADYTDVQSFITALNASTRTSNPAQWRGDLEKVFNVDHFLKYLAVNNTIVNWDAYGAMAHNHYLYNHPSKKLTWIPWDLNYSMTSSNTAGGAAAAGGGNAAFGGRGVSLEMTEVAKSWPLIRFLADDATYYAKYKSYVKDFNTNNFTSAKMNAIIDKHYNLIASAVMQEVAPYSQLSNTASFTSGVSDLKAHIVTRNQAVATFLK